MPCTAVLTQQAASPAAHYAYLGSYIVCFIANGTSMVATAAIPSGSRKLTQRAGRVLKLISGALVLAPGAVMLLRPQRPIQFGYFTSRATIAAGPACNRYDTHEHETSTQRGRQQQGDSPAAYL